MTDTIPGKRYGAIYAWLEGDSWFYLPAAASPQRGPNGRAQITAVEAGGMLMLTLGTSLSVSEQQLDEAKAAITAEAGVAAAPVQLRPADVRPVGAVLTFTPDGGTPVELARANPSALPPYSAAFSAMLRGDQATSVNAAMKGGTGKLEVVYNLNLSGVIAVTARLKGEPGASKDLETALAMGKLTLTLHADAGASDNLRADVRQKIIQEASRLFNTMPPPAADPSSPFPGCADNGDEGDRPAFTDPNVTTTTTNTTTIDTHVTLTEPALRAVRVGANVADWL